MKRTTVISIFAVLAVSTASAQTFDLGWNTIDGGGDMWTTGGNFELSGTIGQPDASAVVMTGGNFELVGGFWPRAAGPGVPGDCDGDGFVDLDDFGVFAVCMAGPMASVPPECGCADLDGDGDVDLEDFAEFQAAFVSP